MSSVAEGFWTQTTSNLLTNLRRTEMVAETLLQSREVDPLCQEAQVAHLGLDQEELVGLHSMILTSLMAG